MPLIYKKARRAYRKGRKYYKKNQSTADRALRVALKTASMLNPEYKVLDTGEGTNIGTTANVWSLSDISQGDGVTQRDGRSCKVTSLSLNGRYLLNSSASADHIRTIVFIDKDSDGATPTATDLLSQADPMSHYNVTTDQNRFRVLYDRLDSLVNDGGDQVCWQFSCPMNHHLKFDGVASSDASYGRIWCLQLGNQATNTCINDVYARIRFLDN